MLLYQQKQADLISVTYTLSPFLSLDYHNTKKQFIMTDFNRAIEEADVHTKHFFSNEDGHADSIYFLSVFCCELVVCVCVSMCETKFR